MDPGEGVAWMAGFAESARAHRPPLGLVIAPDLSGAVEALEAAAVATGRPVVRVVAVAAEADTPLAALRSVDSSLVPDDPVTVREQLTAAHRGSVLLVDDVQWIDAASLTVLTGLAARAGTHDLGLLVSHRPTGGPGVADLDAAIADVGTVVRVDGLTPDEVAARFAARSGRPTPSGSIDAVVEATAGRLALVDLVVDAWEAEELDATGRWAASPPAPVVDALRLRTARLPDEARGLLAVLALAPSGSDALVAAIAGLDPVAAAEARNVVRDAGLLVPGGDTLIPLVATAVAQILEPEVRRRLEGRLGEALAGEHGSTLHAAELMAAAAATGPAAVAAFRAAAVDRAGPDPRAACAWYERALAAGGDPREQVAAHAEVAARAGDLDGAMALARQALDDGDAGHRGTAARVAGVIAYREGHTDLAVEHFTEALHLGESSARRVVDPILAGRGHPAIASVDDPGEEWADRAAVALSDAARRAVEVDPSSPAGFLQAATVHASSPRPVLLVDAPHVLGAVAATVAGDLPVARDLLARAGSDAGPGIHEPSVAVWSAWLAVEDGPAEVSDALPDRDRLVAAAVVARGARRSGDLTALHAAFETAEPLLIGVQPDLWLLEPATELAAASTRLDPHERAERWLDALDDAAHRGGAAAPWRVALAWGRLQVGLAADDTDAVAAAAARMQACDADGLGPGATALVAAGRLWAEIVQGRVDQEAVEQVAADLAAVGRLWEASRLVGQAAVRATDPAVARALLVRARELTAPGAPDDGSGRPGGSGLLSEREVEVSRLVLEGRTHKEIGAQLFLSPKTVEHHVARIRTKLGASTRAEMLAALRRELG